jgi:glutamyl-tRNA synthetase
MLYRHFGWETPVFCHLPLLRNDDKSRSKLSKRKNPTSILYYRSAGYLPEALVNFLGLMGWAPRDGEEKFDLQKMVGEFRLEDVSLGGPVFDVQKLRWLNGRYIREDHDPARLRERLQSWAYDDETFERIAPLAQPRLETLADWAKLTLHFFSDAVDVDPTELPLKGKDERETAELLQLALWRLEAQRDFSADVLEQLFREIAEQLDLKLRDLTRPFYVAVTGAKASTPLFQSMEILGPDLVRVRLRRAIEALGGVSSKKLKQLEKDYAARFGPRD